MCAIRSYLCFAFTAKLICLCNKAEVITAEITERYGKTNCDHISRNQTAPNCISECFSGFAYIVLHVAFKIEEVTPKKIQKVRDIRKRELLR